MVSGKVAGGVVMFVGPAHSRSTRLCQLCFNVTPSGLAELVIDERTSGMYSEQPEGLEAVKTGRGGEKSAPLVLHLVSCILATADHARNPSSCDSDRVRHVHTGVSDCGTRFDRRG